MEGMMACRKCRNSSAESTAVNGPEGCRENIGESTVYPQQPELRGTPRQNFELISSTFNSSVSKQIQRSINRKLSKALSCREVLNLRRNRIYLEQYQVVTPPGREGQTQSF